MQSHDTLARARYAEYALTVAALFAPIVAARALGAGTLHICLAVVATAALLAGFGVAPTVSSGSVGVAIAIGARHGTSVLLPAVAIAGIVAAVLALLGVERLFRSLPQRLTATLSTGLVVAGAIVAARALLGSATAPTDLASLRALVGDTLALALVLSFESSAPRGGRMASARLHLVAATLLLPVSFHQTMRPPVVATLIATGAVVAALALAPVATPLALVGISALTLRALALAITSMRLRDLLAAAAVAVALAAYRPAIAVLFAIMLAIAFTPRAPQTNPE